MRFLAVLILVVQPLVMLPFGAAPVATNEGVTIAACAATDGCCCRPVSCCSTKPAPPCGCIEDEATPPATPPILPSEIRTLLPTLAAATGAVIATNADEVPAIQGPVAIARGDRTHNERRALLCIWRT
ncbi:MAG: hypothetical protein ACYTGG_02350 [Planctomycetota bacterium]|jgi:hypothetical protein